MGPAVQLVLEPGRRECVQPSGPMTPREESDYEDVEAVALSRGGHFRRHKLGRWHSGHAIRGRARGGGRPAPRSVRSEEHTSELQSLMRISYAVFCLKKKKNQYATTRT